MRSSAFAFAAISAAFAFVSAGCSSSPASRIDKDPAVFAAASPEAQAKIRAGQVAVGFTPEQVMLALGKPDRRFSRTTDKGESEVWAYADRGPSFGFGLGVTGGGGSTSVGTGVGVATGGDRGDRLRVVFEGGRVSAVETRGR